MYISLNIRSCIYTNAQVDLLLYIKTGSPLIVSEFMTTKAVLYLQLVVALHDILMKTGTHRYLNEDPSKHGFFQIIPEIVNVQNKWSCLVIGYETMSPIEIYCFIAEDCSVSWPLIGQQRPMLASDWLMMAQYSNGCARCHTTRSVSRMSRGHKHHCHDKSQNWSQTPIVSAA